MISIGKRCRVLAIGAHPDDIELGAGGFIHRLTKEHDATVHFLILTTGIQTAWSSPQKTYDPNTRIRECYKSAKRLGVHPDNVQVLAHPDCLLHKFGHRLIHDIEARLYQRRRKSRFDLVLSHAAHDTHEDHRVAHEATLSAVRDFHRTVLLYPTPSTKPSSFQPKLFVRLDEKSIRIKHAALQMHVSQKDKAFMKESRTRSMASTWSLFLRLPPEAYLEAFDVHKSFL